ncbi:MAG: hypothetical protein RLZZ293_73 [Pseudomonadota bacterium]|jgi:2-C-methyl-D-erythritol 4-phosphate cytidylyltransferase
MNEYTVLIPCAGNGSRFATTLAKQYHSLAGKTVLDWTLQAFETSSRIKQIVVIVQADDPQIERYRTNYAKLAIAKVGGATRAQSVLNGLRNLALTNNDWVLVHDAARCCITPQMINYLIEQVELNNIGGLLTTRVVDTVKQINAQQQVVQTLNREELRLAQTPQMFRYDELVNALLTLEAEKATDEASAIEACGGKVLAIENSPTNLKLTYPSDLYLAEIILQHSISKGE